MIIWLVVGFYSSEKDEFVSWETLPIWENKTCSKPPIRKTVLTCFNWWFPQIGVPQMVGLEWKIPLTWMHYAYSVRTVYITNFEQDSKHMG